MPRHTSPFYPQELRRDTTPLQEGLASCVTSPPLALLLCLACSGTSDRPAAPNPDQAADLDSADIPADMPAQPVSLRVDYALPSRDLTVTGAGVFWPEPGSPNDALTDISDHHPV